MRRTALLGVVIWYLLYQAEAACDLTGGLETTKTFPDILNASYAGYQLTTEISSKKPKETIHIVEYYNIEDKAGKLDIYKNKKYEQFVYFQDSDEAFITSGRSCKSAKLSDNLAIREDKSFDWLKYEDDVIIIGPSRAIRQAYVAWKKNKQSVVLIESYEEDRGIKLDRWRQCIGEATVEYFFSVPSWHNEYDLPNLQVPISVKYITDDQQQTFEFFSFQPYLSNAGVTYIVPEGYGCVRNIENEETVPELGDNNIMLRGEVVYYSVDLEAKSKPFSRFISTFQMTYHFRSDMIAYSYAPWEKGSTNKDDSVKTKPFTRIIWDRSNNIVYSMDLESRTCTLERTSEFCACFDLPGKDEGSINMLDPNILLSTKGFKYLGDRKERGIKVDVFEKEVKPMPLFDKEAAVAVITRTYTSGSANINTGNMEVGSPVSIAITWFNDEEKTKLKGIFMLNIFSFSREVPFIEDYFNVGMCFPNYDDSAWFKIVFPNMGVTKNTLMAHTPQIKREFLGVLFTHTEITPVRIPSILIDVNDEDFSIEVQIFERLPYFFEFDLRVDENAEIDNWNKSVGMVNEQECLQSCVEYSIESGVDCRAASFCGSSCFISTVKDPEASAPGKGKCRLYDRQTISKFLPSMDDLIRSIRTLVVNDEFALTFQVNVGDQLQPVEFKASSFGDSYGDTRDRFIPRLLREEKFKLSLPGMRLSKGEKDQSKPYGKFTLSTCLQICLNDPYCETVSYCKGTECIVSEDFISEVNLDRTEEDNKCIILARTYLQAYQIYPGVVLTRSAKKVVNAKEPGGCARQCTKEDKFKCRSFDYCEDKKQCLLHSTHYIDLKKTGEGVEIKEKCNHYSRKFIYDFKMIPNRRSVGDAQLKLQQNSVEECAQECLENGGYACTAFDFCEGVESIDNKCFLIATQPSQIKTVERTDCRHYLNQASESPSSEKQKRYSNALTGGLGFLFFLIGSVLGVGGTYFFAFKYANRG